MTDRLMFSVITLRNNFAYDEIHYIIFEEFFVSYLIA